MAEHPTSNQRILSNTLEELIKIVRDPTTVTLSEVKRHFILMALEDLKDLRAADEPPVCPVAWMHTHYTPDSPMGPSETDADFQYGDEQPGPGWTPLYLRPTPPQRAPHLREPPHCPSCECGMPAEPPADSPSDEDWRAMVRRVLLNGPNDPAERIDEAVGILSRAPSPPSLLRQIATLAYDTSKAADDRIREIQELWEGAAETKTACSNYVPASCDTDLCRCGQPKLSHDRAVLAAYETSGDKSWTSGGNAEGTHLQGYAPYKYSRIVEVFGEPTHTDFSDGSRVVFEWVMTFKDGTVATIYEYKSSSLYGDDEDAPTPEQMRESFTDWHIGGKTHRAVDLVLAALNGGGSQ